MSATSTGEDTTSFDHHRDGTQGPDPDAEIKPDKPTDLHKPSITYIVRKTLQEFSEDQCTDQAAALTYYAVLAIFPGLLALLSILGLVGQSGKAVDTVINVLGPLVSSGTIETIEPVLRSMAGSQRAGLTLVIGLLGALFSASGYVNAFSRAMNRIYEIQEGRPIWKLRPIMLVVTIVAVVMAAMVLLMLIVSGPLAESVGRRSARPSAWSRRPPPPSCSSGRSPSGRCCSSS